MKNILFVCVAMPILILPLHICAEEIALTLDEAVSIGLRDNRGIMLEAEEVKKAKLKIAEAQAELFPTLDFTSARTYTAGYSSKDIGKTSAQTTLKQYLYKGGKTINKIKYNEHKLEVTNALLEKAQLETVLDIKKSFYTLLLALDFANLNSEIFKNTQKHIDFAERRYQNGEVSETEVLRIKESLKNVESAYEASINQVESAQVLLRNLLFLNDDITIKADGNFNYEPKEVAYDEAFLIAMKNRPEIKQYEAQENADRASIEIVKTDNRPSIYASWDYYTSSRTTSNTKKWQDYSIVGVTFSWPIFDGWETKAKVEQALLDLKQTQIRKEKTIKDITTELKDSYIDLKNAIAKIKPSESQIDLYKDILRTTEEKYKDGITSFLDLEDASLGYDVSIFSQKQAIYDYILAKARFENAMGE